MAQRSRLACTVLAAILALAAPAALAQAAGRLMLRVVDGNGEPVPGVAVTVTSAEKSDFREEETTDDKGVVTFSFADATLVYDFRVEKKGYQGVLTQLRPTVKGIAREEVTLLASTAPAPAAAPAAGESEAARRSYTPAELAFNEAVTALNAGNSATARAKFEEALAKDPAMVQAHSGLAGIHLEAGEHEAAVKAAEAVVAVEPNDTRAWRILYFAHRELGNAEEARRALARLEELDTGGGTAPMLYNEGVEALELGDRETARQRFREAIEADPELVAALDALAMLLLADGAHAEAAAFAERALAKEPGRERALATRYEAYRLLGDEAKAKEALDALVEAAPGRVTGNWLQEGRKRFDAGDAAGAKALFARVLEAQPDHAEAHYRLGLCHVNLGEKEQARHHLQRYLALAPKGAQADEAREMLQYLQ